jgi:hypothetical protein
VAVLAACLGTRIAAMPIQDPFLDEVQHRAFAFFWHESNPATGITKDRAHNFAPDAYDVGSIASTGFALSALPIGVEHGWVSRADAQHRALVTLRFFRDRMPQRHGVFPHFVYLATGKRAWNCEYSTLDTSLFICGAITAGEFFGGEVKQIASGLYRAVDWAYWKPGRFLCHGSRPEEGEFLKFEYSGYSEALLMYVLAIGSPTHPIPPAAWHDLGRWIARYGPYSSIAGSSLFVNQYPNLWVDFRGKTDGVADYSENLRVNTLANRLFCANNAAKYRSFGPDSWGLTAGDGPDDYSAWSGEPGGAWTDGTVNPHAAGGSFAVTPIESRRALLAMLNAHRARIWGRYGFVDGFNLDRNWFDQDVIGIDTGATLLAIENYRTGLVWSLFKKNPAAGTALRRIGFTPSPHLPTAALRIAEATALAPRSPIHLTFALPKPPRDWGARTILLYGGVVEERTISATLNGAPVGSLSAPKGKAYAVALPIPARTLRWGRPNTLVLNLAPNPKGGAYFGPVSIGPRETLDGRPLVVRVEPPIRRRPSGR